MGEETRQRGRVSAIMRDKGFGFVAMDGYKEVFFHSSAINRGTFEELKTGDIVSFLLVKAEKGDRAVAVEVEGQTTTP